jgi:glycopeptide antibiotics resistance protein
MKSSYKILLGLYLTALLWLVLFKFSFDIVTVIEHHQTRILNLIPFAGLSRDNMRETIENIIVFIPLGLLFAINGKHLGFWRKLGIISAISLTVEIIQFILGIGVTDITDFITNTTGGLIGLSLYELGSKYIDEKILNRYIAFIIAVVLLVILFLRLFILRVRY